MPQTGAGDFCSFHMFPWDWVKNAVTTGKGIFLALTFQTTKLNCSKIEIWINDDCRLSNHIKPGNMFYLTKRHLLPIGINSVVGTLLGAFALMWYGIVCWGFVLGSHIFLSSGFVMLFLAFAVFCSKHCIIWLEPNNDTKLVVDLVSVFCCIRKVQTTPWM